jgi:hypothetical protein
MVSRVLFLFALFLLIPQDLMVRDLELANWFIRVGIVYFSLEILTYRLKIIRIHKEILNSR